MFFNFICGLFAHYIFYILFLIHKLFNIKQRSLYNTNVSSNPVQGEVYSTHIMWSSLSVTCDRSVVFSKGNLVSSTNKTDSHDIIEILLKVSLSTINPTLYSTEYQEYDFYTYTRKTTNQDVIINKYNVLIVRLLNTHSKVLKPIGLVYHVHGTLNIDIYRGRVNSLVITYMDGVSLIGLIRHIVVPAQWPW